ncbi:MAG: hypothetical protein U9N86_07840 [Bacteroidota bacterium]|nr:hypothetical protein [Bacteroidota bacterium]
MILKQTLAMAIALALVVSCSNGDGGREAKKLLDKQDKIEQKDKHNLEETKDVIESTLQEMAVLEDSLSTTKDALSTTQMEISEQEKKLEDDVAKLEAEKLQLKLEIQQNQFKKLTDKRDSLSNLLDQTNASLDGAKREAAMISHSRDSLQTKGKVVSQLDEEMNAKLTTGIKEIDTRLELLEEQKRNAQSKISLQEKKRDLGEKKISVLNDERKLYEDHKQMLYDKGASQSEMDAVAVTIATVEDNIDIEKRKINWSDQKIADNQEVIAGIDKQRNRLSKKIRNNYTTQEILDDFAIEEKNRLERKLVRLDTMHAQTLAEREAIQVEKETLEKKLSGIDKKVKKAEGEQIAALKDQKAIIEKELSMLDLEEQNLEKGISKSAETDDSGSSEIEQLEEKFRSKQQALDNERELLAEKKQELSAQKEAIALEKEERNKKAKRAIFILVGLVLVILSSLYFLGRSRKSEKKNKS